MTTASQPTASTNPPRIYYVNPLLLSGRDRWLEVFDHARFLGFDTVLSAPPFLRTGESLFSALDYQALDPALQLQGPCDEAVASLARDAKERGVELMLDLAVSRGGEERDLESLSPTRDDRR